MCHHQSYTLPSAMVINNYWHKSTQRHTYKLYTAKSYHNMSAAPNVWYSPILRCDTDLKIFPPQIRLFYHFDNGTQCIMSLSYLLSFTPTAPTCLLSYDAGCHHKWFGFNSWLCILTCTHTLTHTHSHIQTYLEPLAQRILLSWHLTL